MERLTIRTQVGAICNATAEVCNKQRGNPADDVCCCYCKYEQKMLNKLADYEDAEDNGLLVRLPFAIGTPLYKVVYVKEYNIGCVTPTTMTLKNYADNKIFFDEGMYYTTEEAAEQALAGMQKGE